MSVSELNGFKVSNVARATYNTRTKAWAEEVPDDDLPNEDPGEDSDSESVDGPSSPTSAVPSSAQPENVVPVAATDPDETAPQDSHPHAQWKAMVDVLDEGFKEEPYTEATTTNNTEGSTRTAPQVMQEFLRHDKECTEIDKESLAMAALDPEHELDSNKEPITAYDDLLQRIDRASSQTKELIEEISALDLTAETQTASEEWPSLTSLFDGCVPILKGRQSNLSVARLLVDGAKENRALSIRLRDLELNGSEGAPSPS